MGASGYYDIKFINYVWRSTKYKCLSTEQLDLSVMRNILNSVIKTYQWCVIISKFDAIPLKVQYLKLYTSFL